MVFNNLKSRHNFLRDCGEFLIIVSLEKDYIGDNEDA